MKLESAIIGSPELLAAQAEVERQRDRLKRFFLQAPAGICVLDGPDLVFELVNPSYQQLFPNRELLGKPLLEALPELKDQPIPDILRDVYASGITFEGKELLVPLARTEGGPIEGRYFNFIYQARQDEKGAIDGILVFVIEVTDGVLARHKIEESEGNLRSLVMTARYALATLRGPYMIIEMTNAEINRIWGKTAEETIGRPLLEIFPELKGQVFPSLLKQVYDTGISISQEETELLILQAAGPVKKYISFSYSPLLDAQGRVSGIIVSAEDVTEKVNNRRLLEQNYEQQQLVNEELAASNKDLAKSESRFRALVQQAPVAIFILTGRQMFIEAINDRMLKMLGKTADIVGKPYVEALPEFEGQPFFKLLENVFVTGESFVGNEVRADVEHDGELKEGYFNFIYQPIKDDQGMTNSIICTAVDVTEQVNARKKVERAEESLRMAIDAAELGSYYINAADRIFVASPRLKEFFGFGPDEEVPYEAAINQIHPDYRQAAADLVEAAFTKGVRFDMEYPVIGYHDGKIRWVRGIGTVQHDSEGKNSYFTGVLHEITEKKQDEIRKNDFIGMVSHELKTPLTSLTAILQLLSRQLGDSEDEFLTNALNIANVQVKKMNNMINGFLNVSRLESGKIHIHPQEFDLEKLILDMINEIAFTLTSYTINYVECGSVTVNADRDKIGAVISNLLSNAAKYSPKGKVIDVACKIEHAQAIVSIKDEGIGINQRDIEKIFDRYYRVETNNTQYISGFGIGLYLSAEIIHRHDGKIWADSEIGQGSTFYFSLPLMPR
ncbi:MAG TPA: PAS domain-containing protein [Puia sp.]|nr:PAS domain-containing protein [Puia sp.]